ncbi:MAG: ABC transporter ATP-binding protein [Coprobacillus sp.]
MKKYFIKNKGLFILTTLFSLMSSTALVLVTKQYELVFDIAASGEGSKFAQLIMSSALFIILIFILFYIYLICSKKLIKNILIQMRTDVFQGILNKDMTSFYKAKTSDYISVLTNDMNLIEENLIKPVLVICESVGMFVATVVMLFYYSPLITFVIFLSSAIAFLIPTLLGKYLSRRQKALSKELSLFTNKIKDIFSGFDVIYSFNMFSYMTKNFQKYNQQLANKKYHADRFKVINDTTAQLLGITIQVGTTGLCAYLVITGDMSVGILAAVVQLCSRFVSPLMQIMNNLALVKSMKPIIEKVNELSAINPTYDGATPHFLESINISNLDFSYEKNQPVLKNIHLNIIPYKKYAIMGTSGCGKSTLVKLLLGYYDNFSGDINYDGKDIRYLNQHQLHDMASIIHQNVYMFDESMKDNICLHNDYPDQIYQTALQMSGCQNIITKDFSEESLVGENGSNLSGGQRQRIALARALIRKKQLLILDEGTSAVDMQNAYDIENRLLQNDSLTLLSIMHKTSEDLLEKYDEVIYMDKGQIIEKGTFHTLMKNKGAFYNFYTIRKS